MKERDTHSMQSNHSLSTRPSEPPSILPIQGVSYTFREQLPIQGSQASRKISLFNYLDHQDPSQASLAQPFGVPHS